MHREKMTSQGGETATETKPSSTLILELSLQNSKDIYISVVEAINPEVLGLAALDNLKSSLFKCTFVPEADGA